MPFLLLIVALFGACSQQAPSEPRGAALDAGSEAGSASLDAAPSVPRRASRDASSVDSGPPAEFLGTVHGVIKLARGAALPIAPPVRIKGQVPSSVAPCPAVDVNDQRIVARDPASGGLSPVHVALTEMSAVPTRAPEVHELFIDACRLRPTLVGALRGDTVRVTNRSPSVLLPILPGDTFMRGLMRGETRDFALTRLGPTAVECAFGNYCGKSLVIGVSHPLYAVSDDKGRFTIRQVPLGQELKLNAWHPLFQVTTVSVELSRAEPEKTVELTLQPTPSAAASTRTPSSSTPRAPAKGRSQPNTTRARGPQ